MRIHKTSHHKAMTLAEIVLVMGMIALLTGIVILSLDPLGYKQKARDNRRTSDLATLDRIINEYKLDTGNYPDDANVTRYSNVRTDASIAETTSINGWIHADLNTYSSHLPIDPINDNTNRYSYIHDTTSYELNAVLDDGSVYEIGNNLNLIN